MSSHSRRDRDYRPERRNRNSRGGEWRARAACRGHDPELFFPDPSDTVGAKAAKAICADCPVRFECLDDANRHHAAYGIWGGQERTGRGGPLRPRGRPQRSDW